MNQFLFVQQNDIHKQSQNKTNDMKDHYELRIEQYHKCLKSICTEILVKPGVINITTIKLLYFSTTLPNYEIPILQKQRRGYPTCLSYIHDMLHRWIRYMLEIDIVPLNYLLC